VQVVRAFAFVRVQVRGFELRQQLVHAPVVPGPVRLLGFPHHKVGLPRAEPLVQLCHHLCLAWLVAALGPRDADEPHHRGPLLVHVAMAYVAANDPRMQLHQNTQRCSLGGLRHVAGGGGRSASAVVSRLP